MIYAAMQTLTDELGLDMVRYIRAGINPEHFSEIQADPVPINADDTRSEKSIQSLIMLCILKYIVKTMIQRSITKKYI
jgi:hypothetical protein